jgi:hypothetical protein
MERYPFHPSARRTTQTLQRRHYVRASLAWDCRAMGLSPRQEGHKMDDLEDAVAFAIQSLPPIRAISPALALRPRIGTPICGWRALPFVQLPPNASKN